MKTTLDFCRLRKWNVCWERFSVCQAIYLTMSKNLSTSACSNGVVNFTISFTLAGSGFKALAVSRSPGIFVLSRQFDFFLCWEWCCLPYWYQAFSLQYINVILSQFTLIIMSSMKVSTFFILSKIWISFYGIFRGLTISQTVIFGNCIHLSALWRCITCSFLRPIRAARNLLNGSIWKIILLLAFSPLPLHVLVLWCVPGRLLYSSFVGPCRSLVFHLVVHDIHCAHPFCQLNYFFITLVYAIPFDFV